MRRLAVTVLAAGLLLVAAPLARATGTPAEVTVIGAAGQVDDAVLIGAGGETWRLDGQTWRRAGRGGVAATLTQARGAAANDGWALGATLAPYHWNGTTWTAVPVEGGGDAVLATGALLAVAGGRRVHLREQAKWRTLAAIGGKKTPRIVAAWAGGPKEVAVVSQDGSLRRLTGGRWTELPAGERIERLLAGASGAPYAIGDGGLIARVDGKALKALTVDARVSDFRPRLAAGAGPKDLRLLGAATVDGKAVHALARVEKAQVVYVDALPDGALGAGDTPVALLVAKDGAVLVVTQRGVVLRRAAAGGWSTEPLDATPPADDASAHGKNPPARTATP